MSSSIYLQCHFPELTKSKSLNFTFYNVILPFFAFVKLENYNKPYLREEHC